MARDVLDLVVDAILASIQRIGTTPAGVVYGIAGGVAFYFVKRSGLQMRSLLEVFVIGFVMWLPFFAFELARIPYQKFQTAKNSLNSAEQRIMDLQGAVNKRRHYFDHTEPAFENAWGVTSAFAAWRKTLGDESPQMLLVTADKGATGLGDFNRFAVQGSEIGNGNLQNIGITPDEAEEIERRESKDGTLMFFAASDAKGAMQLFDRLSSLVFRMERSYKMPSKDHPLPKNMIWLHFGKGVRWSSEYWDEQKTKKPAP